MPSLFQGVVGRRSPEECLQVEGGQGDGAGAVVDAAAAVAVLQVTGCTVVQQQRHVGLLRLTGCTSTGERERETKKGILREARKTQSPFQFLVHQRNEKGD